MVEVFLGGVRVNAGRLENMWRSVGYSAAVKPLRISVLFRRIPRGAVVGVVGVLPSLLLTSLSVCKTGRRVVKSIDILLSTLHIVSGP